ncbi:MAG: zinc-ribbon domain-containing protein [Candidatus Methanomethylophilaceae archaeon]|jgi:hypothetical protein
MVENTQEFCTHCGAKLETGSAFCPECGNPVEGSDYLYRSGPESANYVYGVQDADKARANKRLTWIYFLLMGYVILGSITAIVGMSFGALVEITESDPDFIAALAEYGLTVADLSAMVDPMFMLGLLFAVSVALVTVSFVLCILRRKHLFALILCAAGSVIPVFSAEDGIIFMAIGLLVTYFLYTAKPAFED